MVESYIEGALGEDEHTIEQAKGSKGMFVIATNKLDAEGLTDHRPNLRKRPRIVVRRVGPI